MRKALLTVLAVLGAFLVTSGNAQAAETLLSQNRPALASSTENAGTPAAAAVDGNNGTRWASTFADNQWLRIDLGSTQSFNRVQLRWEAAYAKGFRIETSNTGNEWISAYSTTTSAGGDQNLAVSGSGRYVRVLVTERATQWGASLWEFQVYGGTGGPIVRVAEFLADCAYTHRLPDDPIVFPNMPGASHMHSFFGATVTNANTTVDDLANSPTSCNPAVDRSSYWVPTFYSNNQPVEPTGTTFYYLGEGVRDDVIARTQPLPYGLRIVAGNAKATGPSDNTISRWSCLHAGDAGAGHDFITCPAGSMLESYLDFPQCWNGRDLDSADHKSHMAYPVNGDCPATHPVPVPKLRQVLRYPVNGSTAGFRLASGGGFTMHGDFFNAWPVDEMARRVNDCIRPIIKCGADGRP
ncbi:DUF1996 domain-containing protein [Kribbella antibiotica]|uniref:DUF1996 domain-containing protein n=1 Tax=Kribbella antibiotica TaxID=190195 RepID=A0A4R4ZJP8_9ACTN|nr:DUF1996 domain-containing protein [Kribbella antibiotica]TDD58725.1 DUF1996 domain-containing protein [Kribbella antibiotica]